ncbi:hypothetical protein GIB67_015751 [Kingdonia uniflora]|uniref:Uncharacterized protein n=1 Tax=Kingdonia uniflora TaxID=39325 RepID=A0A7J7NUG1_9MAGN|nr:hypothetical protein GIB67_015751 [Kingdonia uniflora]
MLKNEGSCSDGNVVLLKRYQAFDMETGKDASVLESRTVKNVPVEIDFKMDSSSANEVSTSGWMNMSDNEGEVGLEQFPCLPGQLVSYPPGSDAFRGFCKAKAVGGWKWGNCGNCLQRDDEEPLDLRFRTVKQSVKSTVEMKESLLNKVAGEETELELVLEGLGLSRKKRVDSRTGSSVQPNPVKPRKITLKYPKKRMLKALPASGTTGSGGQKRARLAVLHGEEDTSKKVARLVKGIWLGIEKEKNELKKANVKLEKELARSRTDALKEVRQLKASHTVAIGQLQVETKANLDKMVEERDRLGHHMMLKGYFEEKMDAIMADTYTEEEEDGSRNSGDCGRSGWCFPPDEARQSRE